jgi:hypothetical protein
MLTIFTIPKPFKDHIGIIQRNAIQSWFKLTPACEVILCGADVGVRETAAKFGVKHIAEIDQTNFGTPLLSSAFGQVQKIALNKIVCYVNADIIMFPNLLEAVQRIPFERFLMVGQRWDLDVKTEIDFESLDWAHGLARELKSRGVLHPGSGSDYFVFPRGGIGELPDFAVGRPSWDNWMIYHARKLGLPVIDSSKAVTVIHQNHNYCHVPQRRGDFYDGPEGDNNLALAGSSENRFTLVDATWLLTPTELIRARTPKHLARSLFRLAIHLRLYALLRKLKHIFVSLLSKNKSNSDIP